MRSRLSMKKQIATLVCAASGHGPDDMHVFSDGEPAYFHYLPVAESILQLFEIAGKPIEASDEAH